MAEAETSPTRAPTDTPPPAGPRVTTRIADGVAWIRMDDGKVNAFSADLLGEVDAAFAEAEAAGAVTVLAGRPGIFSAGFDLKTFGRGVEAGVEMVEAGARLILRLLAHPRPVVTACAGHAYPMGAFLMLAADVRFGVPGPFRLGMNEVAIGLTVPRFAIELARHRLTPPGFARITTAPMFDAEEARRHGYLDHVVDPADLDAAVARETDRLLSLDRDAYTRTKSRINARALTAIRTALEEESRERTPAALPTPP